MFDALNDEISFYPILCFGFAREHQVSFKLLRMLLNLAPIEWWNFGFQSVSRILFTVIRPFMFIHTSTHFCKCGKSR